MSSKVTDGLIVFSSVKLISIGSGKRGIFNKGNRMSYHFSLPPCMHIGLSSVGTADVNKDLVGLKSITGLFDAT